MDKIKDIKERKINLSVGTAVSIILFMVAVIYTSTLRISNIENFMENCKEQLKENSQNIEENKANQQKIDITNADVKARLINIETTLAEIKQSLSNHTLDK